MVKIKASEFQILMTKSNKIDTANPSCSQNGSPQLRDKRSSSEMSSLISPVEQLKKKGKQPRK